MLRMREAPICTQNMIGLDGSQHLTEIAQQKAQNSFDDAGRCHSLEVVLRPVDFAISIAVIHHFSSRERRILAVKAVLDYIKRDGGSALIYVWALEQASSRRRWHEGIKL